MSDVNIEVLKQIGHDLLEEYISLYHGRLSYKTEKKLAYTRLEKQLIRSHNSHFSLMTSKREVFDANDVLRAMVLKRRKDNEKSGVLKVKLAPNLKELQKQASELNKDLLK